MPMGDDDQLQRGRINTYLFKIPQRPALAVKVR